MTSSSIVVKMTSLSFLAFAACDQVPVSIADSVPTLEAGVVARSDSFSCPHSESRQIFFSSSSTPDELKLDIVGDDCDTARLVMAATSASGDVVYWNEVRALDYTYELQGPAGVEAMLENLIPEQVTRGGDLPIYEELEADELFGKIDLLAYQDARKNSLPLFCHTAGKSYSTCHVFSDGKAVLLYENGS